MPEPIAQSQTTDQSTTTQKDTLPSIKSRIPTTEIDIEIKVGKLDIQLTMPLDTPPETALAFQEKIVEGLSNIEGQLDKMLPENTKVKIEYAPNLKRTRTQTRDGTIQITTNKKQIDGGVTVPYNIAQQVMENYVEETNARIKAGITKEMFGDIHKTEDLGKQGNSVLDAAKGQLDIGRLRVTQTSKLGGLALMMTGFDPQQAFDNIGKHRLAGTDPNPSKNKQLGAFIEKVETSWLPAKLAEISGMSAEKYLYSSTKDLGVQQSWQNLKDYLDSKKTE